jgi:RNA polymerase sigma-70 factor, ECF subfamily
MMGASPLQRASLSDQRWCAYVDAIRQRDSNALACLYDETAGPLYGLALRILNDTADAEEIVMDVYQHVWRSAATFDSGRGSVWGWLTVLTRSRAIDRLRRAGTRRNRELPIEGSRETPSALPAPETESIFRQERAILRQAVATLNAEQREAIELAFFRGLTHVEVAEALGTPLGTIKTRIRVGIQKLREALVPAAPGGGAT